VHDVGGGSSVSVGWRDHGSWRGEEARLNVSQPWNIERQVERSFEVDPGVERALLWGMVCTGIPRASQALNKRRSNLL
jgi:hypothetical protein